MDLDNFKYNLRQVKKCGQYWDEMNPVVGGRLCAKCEKTIIDFSGMSFTDIAIFMSERKEPVCGFYLPGQLQQINLTKSRLPLAIGLSTIIATSSIASPEKPNLHTIEIAPTANIAGEPSLEDLHFQPVSKTDTVFFIGRVQYFDSSKQINHSIAYATVIIKGSVTGVVTTHNGDFMLPYSTADSGQVILVISSVGLKSKEIELSFHRQQEIDLGIITLQEYEGEIVTSSFYVTTKKRSKLNRFWRTITKPFR